MSMALSSLAPSLLRMFSASVEAVTVFWDYANCSDRKGPTLADGDSTFF
jgi:hypothetical protein